MNNNNIINKNHKNQIKHHTQHLRKFGHHHTQIKLDKNTTKQVYLPREGEIDQQQPRNLKTK